MFFGLTTLDRKFRGRQWIFEYFWSLSGPIGSRSPAPKTLDLSLHFLRRMSGIFRIRFGKAPPLGR